MGLRVVITDVNFPHVEMERRELGRIGVEPAVFQCRTEREVIEAAHDADGIIVQYAPITARVIGQLPRCRVIARYGIGVDNVDVGAATEHGIVVANVPGFCVEELADHAMALVLAFARQVVTYRDSTRGGAWDTFVTPRPLQRLAGQTLGLIGFGASARAVARRARAFGLRVLAYTPRLTAERAGEHQVEAVSLATLLRESDYVSIHCPLTSETRHLIGWSELQRMKPTAYLINTARGAIVDEEALVRALDEGVIAGAGLDVLVAEPPAPEHPLLHRDNVIVTPHAAFYSEQALLDLQARAARAVADVLDGRMPESIVNREVLGRARARLAP